MIKSLFKKHYIIAAAFLLFAFCCIGVDSAMAIDLNQGACKSSNSAPCKASSDSVAAILKNVINIMLYLAGAIAVVMVVVGGIRYITSDGDPAAANKAKNTIIYALVGVVVAVMSYSIVNFVIGRV